jgi:hypothetical protein
MFCANCGKQNPDDTRFCESCGAPTAGDAQQAPVAPPPPVYAAPPAAPYGAPPPQPYYQQPAPPPPQYGAAATGKMAEIMTVGQYLVTYIVLAIPIVGFIMLLIWSFGNDVNPNKKNLCRTMLIISAISIVLMVVLWGAIAAILIPLFEQGFNY